MRSWKLYEAAAIICVFLGWVVSGRPFSEKPELELLAALVFALLAVAGAIARRSQC